MDNKELLKGRYEIKNILGRGGFATTYLAIDTTTNNECAIKCLSFEKISDWKTMELFEREARVLANLNHPQIPKYIDFFTEDVGNKSEVYLVQEYIKGKSLAQLVQEGRHFTEKETINIAIQIADILEYLHSFSPPIIHRDIKPTNIVLKESSLNPPFIKGEKGGFDTFDKGKEGDFKVYLIDFGAVRDKMLSEKTKTGGSTIIGTYGYMPIEQFDGRAVPATDIYSLGVTLVHLLSHKDPTDIEKKGLNLDFRPHTNISDDFAMVLEKMLEADWARRYQSVERLKMDLNRILLGKKSRVYYPPLKQKTKINSRLILYSFIALIILFFFIRIAFYSKPKRPKYPESNSITQPIRPPKPPIPIPPLAPNETGQWANEVLDYSSQYSSSGWSANQILNEPNTYTCGDITTAWATKEPNKGYEFIELKFEEPVHSHRVEIYETFNPGAVVKLEARDSDGNLHTLWEGQDNNRKCPGCFIVKFSETDYKTNIIRITMNTTLVLGWNEIDAVRLIGKGQLDKPLIE